MMCLGVEQVQEMTNMLNIYSTYIVVALEDIDAEMKYIEIKTIQILEPNEW